MPDSVTRSISSANDHVVVMPYADDDREAVLALAPRLCIGVAPWRPLDGVRSVVGAWFEESVDAAGEGHAVFVARVGGAIVGMVAVWEQRHWSGALDAYIGELATAEDHEGRGIGRALLAAAERWAAARGLEHITLETGSGNTRARGFYRSLGFREEEVRLTRTT
jgi:ribosomal protein S18 acetylase RimI-like enzyme